MRRMPAAVRYLTLHRLAFCVTALTVLVTAVATAAIAAFAAAAATTANRETLTDNPASSVLVTATTTQFAAETASVARVISHSAPGLPITFIAAPQSVALDLPAGHGGRRAQTYLLGLSQVRQHARLAAGSWPTASGAGPIQACLPVRAAQLLGLASGDVLAVRDSVGRASFDVRISCTFTELDPASPYWQLNAIGTTAVTKAGGFTSYGPMVTTRPSASWPVQSSAANWLAIPDFGAMTAGNLSNLGGSIGAALSALSNSSSISPVITTSLPTLLTNQAVALQVARSQLLIGQLILLVIAGAALAVAVNLLASQRAGEPGLLMARGATRRQLAARGGADAALLAIPAAIGGPLLGAWLAPQMARLGLIGTGSLSIPGGLPAVAWVAGVAVAAGCALIIALPWLRRPISPIRRRAGRVRPRTMTAALSSGADIALVLLAVAASWQLAQYSAPVSTGVSGVIGVDPILVAAPVLALTAGTLIMLRLLPLLIRLTERIAARGRGITVPTAAWMISRRTMRQAGPALLTVLAVATAVIALAEGTSWRDSVQDQAGFTVGGDTSITMPVAAPLPIGQVAQITGARGVRAVTPVIRAVFSLPNNDQATLLGLDAHSATAIVPLRRDLLVKPLTNPLGPIGEGKGPTGVVLPGQPTGLQVVAGLSRCAVTQAVLTVQLSDAAGVSYQLTAGALPANGTFQRFGISLSPGRRADYPVTLTGFSLQYQMPQVGPHQQAALTISSVSPASASGQPGPAVPAIGPVAGQHPDLSATTPQLMSWTGKEPFGAPTNLTWTQRDHGAVLRFAIGAGSNSIDGPGFPESADATLTVAAPPAAAALPAVATKGFLAASGQHLGDTIQVNDLSAPVPVHIVAEVSQFPTITTSGGGLVVSEPALQQYLEDNGGGPMSITEWWLSDTGTPAFGQLPAGSVVTTKAAVATSLGSQPLEVAPLRSLLAVAVVALALAGLGFLVSASSSRERGRDLAVLDALGATPGQLARVLCLEQGLLSVPAAAGGLALGLLLSRLIIPAVTLTAQAAHPIPSVLVRIPLTPALAVAAVIAAVPIAAVALSVVGGTGTMARLRAEEEL
jgi:hypothetical protein